MSPSFLAAFLTLLSLTIYCGPPLLALRMLTSRMRRRPRNRTLFLALCTGLGLMLLFNLCVAFGLTAPLGMVIPSGMTERAMTTALLFAWLAAGICVLLAVVAPYRRPASDM